MLAEASPKELLGGGVGGGSGADDPGVAMLMLLLVVPIAGRLLDLLLGYGAKEESAVEGVGGTTGPRIGKAGVVSSLIEREVAAFPAGRSSTRWLTVRIGEKPEEEPAPDIVIAAGLLSLGGLARLLPLVMFAPIEDIRPEPIGGAVSVVYDPLPLPLLWYEPAAVPLAASAESIAGLPATPSEEMNLLSGPFPLLEKKPMLESIRPPANDGWSLFLFLSQQLHPVSSMPRLQAPIRPTKGILPIGLSSPV